LPTGENLDPFEGQAEEIHDAFRAATKRFWLASLLKESIGAGKSS
jgi:hypothetical protein